MHRIDRKWVDLAAGYQAVQSFNNQLTTEFGRAVQVGHKLQFRKELSEWQKKRRIFFALVAVAPLSIIALCLTAFYFRAMACVIIYWAVLVLIILVTLAVAGRQYVGEMVNGKPVPRPAGRLVIDLEGRWWESLSPREMVSEKAGKKGEGNFLVQLFHSLPDSYFAYIPLETGVVLLGPSGIWIFKVENWGGMVVKQEGVWRQIQTLRDNHGRTRQEEKIHEPGPDVQWLQLKQENSKALEEHLPDRAWTLGLIQGGVVFSHPKAKLDKKSIQGNTASYGPPKAWVERIRRAPAVDGFTLDIQLEILETLFVRVNQPAASAKEEAERLYRQAVEELRVNVAKMVK